jgi:hypothetical protein
LLTVVTVPHKPEICCKVGSLNDLAVLGNTRLGICPFCVWFNPVLLEHDGKSSLVMKMRGNHHSGSNINDVIGGGPKVSWPFWICQTIRLDNRRQGIDQN